MFRGGCAGPWVEGMPVVGVRVGSGGGVAGGGCGVWLFLVFLRMLCLSLSGGGWGCVGVVG